MRLTSLPEDGRCRTPVTVLYPAYNEEAALQSTVERSVEALRTAFLDFEILVLDDASTDSTPQIAEELASRYPEVQVARNDRNLGQGGTLVRGFEMARTPLVIHNGVDYPFDLQDLPRLVAALEDADIVVAVRHARPGYTLTRRVLSLMNVALIRLLFGMRLRDYNFVQLYRREVLERVPFEARSTAFLTPEILIRAHDLGYRISEVEVEYHRRESGHATSGKPRVLLTSFRDMVRYWWTRWHAAWSSGRRRPC